MGRKLVEATNAWRILRTRGDIGRLRLLVPARRVRVGLVCDFLAPAAGVFVPGLAAVPLFAAGFEDFDFAAGVS